MIQDVCFSTPAAVFPSCAASVCWSSVSRADQLSAPQSWYLSVLTVCRLTWIPVSPPRQSQPNWWRRVKPREGNCRKTEPVLRRDLVRTARCTLSSETVIVHKVMFYAHRREYLFSWKYNSVFQCILKSPVNTGQLAWGCNGWRTLVVTLCSFTGIFSLSHWRHALFGFDSEWQSGQSSWCAEVFCNASPAIQKTKPNARTGPVGWFEKDANSRL